MTLKYMCWHKILRNLPFVKPGAPLRGITQIVLKVDRDINTNYIRILDLVKEFSRVGCQKQTAG